MSGPDTFRATNVVGAQDRQPGVVPRKPKRGPLEFGTIVVIGGGCYGTYYLRQLLRARDADAVSWERVLVVDRDSACAVARESRRPAVDFVCSTWADFLSDFLGRAVTDAGTGAAARAGDAVVPSPLMPHLLFEWLVGRARERWPRRSVLVRPLGPPPSVPWERAAPDGSVHYVSFAEWMCPINCIEPSRCPVTRGARDWTMPAALEAHVAARRDAGHVLEGPLVFHCTHRAFGVGMIDVRDVVLADRRVAEAAKDRAADFLVGTVSHCHGALGVLSIAD